MCRLPLVLNPLDKHLRCLDKFLIMLVTLVSIYYKNMGGLDCMEKVPMPPGLIVTGSPYTAMMVVTITLLYHHCDSMEEKVKNKIIMKLYAPTVSFNTTGLDQGNHLEADTPCSPCWS